LSKYPYNEINGKHIVEVRHTISSSASTEDVEKRKPFFFYFYKLLNAASRTEIHDEVKNYSTRQNRANQNI
jgi:hypothetical protein